jgi:hypothetical protein
MDKNEKQSSAATSSLQEKPRQEKPRPTREEIMERKISMAKEKNTRVAKIDSPLGGIIFNIMRQFDQAYDKFKGKLGEFGGTSHDKGIVYMQKAQEVTLMFSQPFPTWLNLSLEDLNVCLSFLLNQLAHDFSWLRCCFMA